MRSIVFASCASVTGPDTLASTRSRASMKNVGHAPRRPEERSGNGFEQIFEERDRARGVVEPDESNVGEVPHRVPIRRRECEPLFEQRRAFRR